MVRWSIYNMPSPRFNVGDLVQFDSFGHTIGIVTDVKNSPSFDPPEKIADVLVYWSDGIEFWCLDFCLVIVSKCKTN